MRSSQKFLGIIERSAAERMLMDWANLKDEDSLRFLQSYAASFSGAVPITNVLLLSYRDLLRKAWNTQNSFQRNWHLSVLRISIPFNAQLLRADMDVQTADPALIKPFIEPPERPSKIDAALFYLESVIDDRAKYCQSSDCEQPYFIAEKRWQKYCSEDCARPANLKAKRKWWREKGPR